MKKLLVLVAGGVGYVLGTKAGRERYEQIRGQFNKVKDDPRVQEKAQQATDLAKEKAPVVKDKVTSAAGTAADKAKSAAPSSGTSSTGTSTGTSTSAPVGTTPPVSDTTDELNPDRLRLQDDTGPKGPLP